MPRKADLTGMRFGKLTVIEQLQEREDRYITYRCRCDCGNDIVANTKRLRRGTIRGCANCCPKRSPEERRIIGRRFGKLTVLERNKEAWNGRGAWSCRCDCGNIAEVSGSDLLNGRVTNCRQAEDKHRRWIDLTGLKVGWLTVIEKTCKRSSKGSIIWKCECRCGSLCEYSADELLHGGIISCGCYRRTVLLDKMQESLHKVDGTCVEFLQRKMRCDNTSGYRGVDHLKNGKWRAQITFKGKRHYLGTYEKLEDAVVARQNGERFHKEFLADYYMEHPEQLERKTMADESIINDENAHGLYWRKA